MVPGDRKARVKSRPSSAASSRSAGTGHPSPRGGRSLHVERHRATGHVARVSDGPVGQPHLVFEPKNLTQLSHP